MVVLALVGASCTKAKPNFAGTWDFDVEATKASAAEAKMDGLALFMEHFTAEQDAKAFTMKVDLGQMTVTAAYKLDGSVSKNMSPAGVPGADPIEVTSNATWDGNTLVVTSTSSSASAGGPVEVKSTRKMWLDEKGRLVIERFGTPDTLVRHTRSVYTQAKK
jgi:hypothetical protein